jgi:DNA-directed RNA polymerase subunit RPC12/RpoP
MMAAEKLPDTCIDELIESARRMAVQPGFAPNRTDGETNAKAESKPEKAPALNCAHCHSSRTVHYGRKGKKARYRCNACGKTFVETTRSTLYHSRYPRKVWNEVATDTVNGEAID